MARRARRNHSSAFKAKVAVAAIKGERTLIELAQDFDVQLDQYLDWLDRRGLSQNALADASWHDHQERRK